MAREEFWSAVTVDELADALGRSPGTVKDWPWRGIPGTELLRVMKFAESRDLAVSLEDWVELSATKRSGGRDMAQISSGDSQ